MFPLLLVAMKSQQGHMPNIHIFIKVVLSLGAVCNYCRLCTMLIGILWFIYSCTIRQHDISGLQALLTRYEVFIWVFIPHSYQPSIWTTIDIIIIHVFIKCVGVSQLHSTKYGVAPSQCERKYQLKKKNSNSCCLSIGSLALLDRAGG